MGILDSDSDDDSSVCSVDVKEEKEFTRPPLKRNCSGSSTCSTNSVTDGDVEERLSAIMSLKANIGMEQDPEFLAKEKKREDIQRAQEEEKEKLANMTDEERVEWQKHNVGDMMSIIRAKRENSRRNLMDSGTESKGKKPLSKEDDEMAEFRRLKLKKANSRKRLQKKNKELI